MIKQVEEHIKQYNMVQTGDLIVAGVSGGADSVCMLMQLVEYKNEVDFELKVVHINHLIRDDASLDANFVKELCDRYNIEFLLFEEDVEKQAKELGLSTEEAGRRIRYQRFNEVMANKAGKIAVAHNRNDVAETTLFNIFRGTGIEGLASLLPVNGNIIRPLIGVSRKDIEEYLLNNNQSYRTDSTNATNDYARNKIRNVILPYAENEIVTGATNHVSSLSEKMILVRSYIEKEVNRIYDDIVIENKDIEVPIGRMKEQDELIQQELVLKILDKLTIGRKDIGQVHVEAVLSLLDKQGEKKIDLPYNMEAIKQYDKLIVREKSKGSLESLVHDISENSDIELPNEMHIKTKVFLYEPGMLIPQNTYTKWFDYDKITECLKLRTRMPGDYLTVNDKLQKKSLKDYMIDIKIPKDEREKQLIIADSNHVVWVVGYRISEQYKVSDSTKKIIEISVE